MTNQKMLDTYGFLLVSNARCMGFLHGVADNLAKQNDIKSKETAKQIFEFLIEVNDTPNTYYCENFQKENSKIYMQKLIEVNKSIAITVLNNLTNENLLKAN
jgi:hypothetical protein